jgi:hypothetical protein
MARALPSDALFVEFCRLAILIFRPFINYLGLSVLVAVRHFKIVQSSDGAQLAASRPIA